MSALLNKLVETHDLTDSELLLLIQSQADQQSLQAAACHARDALYGKRVFIRGLIEFTNYCKQNCLYCGIRAGNLHAQRYRLSKGDILNCCKSGYSLGFRTFVLQGGEDSYFTDERLCNIVSAIKQDYPDCAVTLSVGERSRESYQCLRDAGADRYLLRHETATDTHFAKLHPANQTLASRMQCLSDLRDIGFQVGCGFMVGSPFQTDEKLVRDLRFIKTFKPHMVGIGPFIPHRDTPFSAIPAGSVDKTLQLLAIVRLLLPGILLPATTALGTAMQDGRERGILAGANVIMPNLSPESVRVKYMLYNNKRCTGDEAAEHLEHLNAKLATIGYQTTVDRGDSLMHN